MGKSALRVCLISFGATDYSFALANALSDYCDIDLYYSKYHVAKEDISITDAFKYKSNIKSFECYRNRDVRNIHVFNKLTTEMIDKEYDIIHIQEYGPFWLYLFLNKWLTIPIVMTVHDPHQHNGIPILNKVYQDVMQLLYIYKAETIFVLGDILKSQLLARYTRLSERNVVVTSLGDLGFMKYWNNDDTNNKCHEARPIKQILFFGSVRAYKGLEYLLKADQIVRSRITNYELVVAGKFDNYKKYQKLIEKNNNIRVIDEYIEYKNIPKYFNDATFVVLPYTSATQSGVVQLSFTFGKPVVATKVGSLPAVIQDGITGLLVEPGNELSLAEAIVSLLTDDKKLNAMCENVRRYCNVNMSWTSIAKKTIKVYNSTIDRKIGQMTNRTGH